MGVQEEYPLINSTHSATLAAEACLEGGHLVRVVAESLLVMAVDGITDD